MGAYASKFHESGGTILLESTDPSQSNWITAHAEICKMSIPEVQRCWSRFLMLDPDHNGNVKRSTFWTKDELVKKLCQQIPIVNDEVITFQAYCSAVSWLSSAPQDSKIRGFFQTLTSSTMTKESLKVLLSNLYPSEESKEIDDLCHLLLFEIDKKNKGEIDEDQFVSWVHSMPREQITSILNFPILPLEVTTASERELSSVPVNIDLEDKWRIRDDQLQHVASLMDRRKRDWRLLANNLGFLEKDCIFFEQNNSMNRDKILDMLQVWRSSLGKQAQAQSLQKALKHTGNADIANDIFNLNF
ncbi:uncharacterized protein LOC122927648 [Bufo gargarizans]|uniref:uncharacterized protein LOC122927648 n=1 Tax=Bufo gargarizans TaxID=30331 RepID=UPI001CF25DED|nr:uncharacterized protein LOC122927648 [Bufo gargarizans]